MNSPRLLSPPVKVYWEGWESNTHRLHQCGWDISAYTTPDLRATRVALRHKSQGWEGMSGIYTDHYSPSREEFDFWKHITLRFQLASRFIINVTEPNMHLFSPVDPVPQFYDTEFKSFNDFCLFKTLPRNAKDVLLEMPTFEEVMKYALKLQQPVQAELREKARRAEAFGGDMSADVGGILRVV